MLNKQISFHIFILLSTADAVWGHRWPGAHQRHPAGPPSWDGMAGQSSLQVHFLKCLMNLNPGIMLHPDAKY